MTPSRGGAAGADAVADGLWERVRELSQRVDRMQRVADEQALDDADRMQLDRARVRLARAVERAQLADALADGLSAVTRRRGRC